MYGIYLQCDSCGATIGGEDVTPKEQGAPTLRRGDGQILRARAGDIGWAYSAPDNDLCPSCTHKEPEKEKP